MLLNASISSAGARDAAHRFLGIVADELQKRIVAASCGLLHEVLPDRSRRPLHGDPNDRAREYRLSHRLEEGALHCWDQRAQNAHIARYPSGPHSQSRLLDRAPQHSQFVAQQQQFRVAMGLRLPNQEQVDEEAEANVHAGQEHERRG